MGWLFLVLGVLLSPFQVHAYKMDLHFYLTHALGVWCGLDRVMYGDHDLAHVIAWANFMTDEDDHSSPGAQPHEWFDFEKVDDRRIFHFPSESNGTPVIHNSFVARRILRTALRHASPETLQHPESNITLLFGIGLHALQDSWSHEGYSPRFGHAWTLEPDYPIHDLSKAFEMAKATWEALDQFKMKVTGSRCMATWELIDGIVHGWLEFPADSRHELTYHWSEIARAVVGKRIRPKDLNRARGWQNRFEWVARTLKKQYLSKGY